MQCRLCKSENLKIYYTQGNNHELKFYKCHVCKLINYDISNGLDQTKYSKSYTDPFDKNIKMNETQTKTYEFIKSNLNIRGELLDIGCGNGRLLYLFQKDGWIVKGLELSSFLSQAIKNKLNIDVDVSNFLEYNKNYKEKYDVVVMRHVLEHLSNSILALSKINSFLKINGYAVLEFPNIEGLDLKIKRFIQRCGVYKKKYRKNYKPGHCNEFSRRSFEYLTSKTGFEIVLWETYSYKPITNFIYNRIKIGNKARTIIKKVQTLG